MLIMFKTRGKSTIPILQRVRNIFSEEQMKFWSDMFS